MKRLSLIALTLAAPLAVMGQTVFSDNFAADVSDPSLNYLSANTTGGTGWVWANGTGITLNPAAVGKLSDVVGAFPAVTLSSAGDSISFIVNFNSPNISQAGASLPGALLFALDNSLGVSPTSAGPTESVSSAATGGPTAGYLGYLGNLSFTTSPKTGTKFFAKTGTGNNNLSYNSNVLPKTQLSTSVGNASNASFLDNTAYTLTYTITALNAGASQNQITATINQGVTVVESFTFGATNGAVYVTPTTTYDTFDIGIYTGNEPTGYNINLTSVSVVANVPEPASAALFLGGIGALALVRRFRR